MRIQTLIIMRIQTLIIKRIQIEHVISLVGRTDEKVKKKDRTLKISQYIWWNTFRINASIYNLLNF